MQGKEILGRSSACVIYSDAGPTKVISCLHVVHPFRYPQYYKHVSELAIYVISKVNSGRWIGCFI